MKRFLVVPYAACTLFLATGCHLFHHKSSGPAQPKESSKIATDVEHEFEQRWVDKRASDLVAQGMNADAAHQQAVTEFRVKFSATKAAEQP